MRGELWGGDRLHLLTLQRTFGLNLLCLSDDLLDQRMRGDLVVIVFTGEAAARADA